MDTDKPRPAAKGRTHRVVLAPQGQALLALALAVAVGALIGPEVPALVARFSGRTPAAPSKCPLVRDGCIFRTAEPSRPRCDSGAWVATAGPDPPRQHARCCCYASELPPLTCPPGRAMVQQTARCRKTTRRSIRGHRARCAGLSTAPSGLLTKRCASSRLCRAASMPCLCCCTCQR